MHQRFTNNRPPMVGLILLFVAGMALTACVAPMSSAATATAEETPTAISAPAVVVEATDATSSAPTTTRVAPVQISLSALDLNLPVTAMGWRMVVVDGVETTVWDVPTTSLGWQINSAAPGEAGNMLIAGHQAQGDALLAPLALNELAPGQQVVVMDAAGATFRYLLVEVSAPLPVVDATPDEAAQAAAYMAADGDARLTLITGWPDFTTTHRIFAVAELLGPTE